MKHGFCCGNKHIKAHYLKEKEVKTKTRPIIVLERAEESSSTMKTPDIVTVVGDRSEVREKRTLVDAPYRWVRG